MVVRYGPAIRPSTASGTLVTWQSRTVATSQLRIHRLYQLLGDWHRLMSSFLGVAARTLPRPEELATAGYCRATKGQGGSEEKLYEWRADYAGVWMYHC